MSGTEKLLVCANGNDGQLSQLKLFCETLLDPAKGRFRGDVCILSTGLSPKSRECLEGCGASIHIDELDWLFETPLARKIGVFELVSQRCKELIEHLQKRPPEGESADLARLRDSAAFGLFKAALRKGRHEELWEERGRKAFSIYRNKHFSKMGLASFLKSCGRKYSKILLCDGDMVFQRDVSELFNKAEGSRICVCDEINAITPGTHIYRSNALAMRLHRQLSSVLATGKQAHELNVGVLLGEGSSMERLLEDWKRLMFDSGFEDLFTAHPSDFWHEQDFMRLHRDMNPDLFHSLTAEEIIHLCNLGHTAILEKDGFFKLRSNGCAPIVVHFAGGAWSKYPAIKRKYLSHATT